MSLVLTCSSNALLATLAGWRRERKQDYSVHVCVCVNSPFLGAGHITHTYTLTHLEHTHAHSTLKYARKAPPRNSTVALNRWEGGGLANSVKKEDPSPKHERNATPSFSVPHSRVRCVQFVYSRVLQFSVAGRLENWGTLNQTRRGRKMCGMC